MFTKLGAGKKDISVPGATWLQLQFADVQLGAGGTLSITDTSGQTQTFNAQQIKAWGGLSAVFNGAAVSITLRPGRGATAPVSATIKQIVMGLPASPDASPKLRGLLGPDLRKFIPADALPARNNGALLPNGAGIESICGANDDRVASNNPRAGRIMPVGCTAWLVSGGRLLTAGHCAGASMQTVQFNVPASLADGTTVAPPVRHQYRVMADSTISQNGGLGNDWAVFRVLPNTETGLMPAVAQGAAFDVSSTANPALVRVTGYGVDGPAPNFGAGGPRNAQNQTQQTHVGTLSGNTGGETSGVLRYNPDTQGGNSGSPVIVEGTNTTIGIHTHGGCSASGGTNGGTSFRNRSLQRALNGTDDVLWQHTNGTVHYWPMRDGQRLGGFNIGGIGPVGADWRLKGAGDLNGDGTDDILWQHNNGTVHYWPIRNGNRLGGFNIGGIGPVGADWKLIGGGDFNGDGTDDILWQHNNGTVHYWTIRDGVRQGGFNIGAAGPVGPEWSLKGAGDLNGDGTDDIVWQHLNGTVHYWPIVNGVRQGGFNIGATGPVGPEWKLRGLGDMNADGTDDIVWQHNNGTTHYWTIINGVRQGGFNIGGAGPVGAEWRLIDAGNLNSD